MKRRKVLLKKVIGLFIFSIVLSCFFGCKSTEVKNDTDIEWREITGYGFQPVVGSYDCLTTSKTEFLERTSYGIDLWYKTLTQNENIYMVISKSENDDYDDGYNELDNDEYNVNINRISRELHVLYEFVSEQTYKTYSIDVIKYWGKEHCTTDDKNHSITVSLNEVYSELKNYNENDYSYNYPYSKFISNFSPEDGIIENSYMECKNSYYTDFKENYKVVNDIIFTDLKTLLPQKFNTSTVFKIQN